MNHSYLALIISRSKNRGSPSRADMETSGPALFRESMPWSCPSWGITGNLGPALLSFMQEEFP